jgi:putative restriction endonuclease
LRFAAGAAACPDGNALILLFAARGSRGRSAAKKSIRSRVTAVHVYVSVLVGCTKMGSRCTLICSYATPRPWGPSLGKSHNGPDVHENVICLCLNRRTLFDLGAFYFHDDLSIGGRHEGRLSVHAKHRVHVAHVQYHRARFESLAAPTGSGETAERDEPDEV